MTIRTLWALVLAGSAAFAQTTAAQLTGRVVDPSGAVVAGASVTAINDGTGMKRETASNELGNYTLPLLDPGNYRVLVEKEGFRAVSQTGITLHVNQIARIDFVLELGALTETVSVTANAPLLQATEASLGALVDNRKIISLPLNGRNPFDLVRLAPGVVTYPRDSLPGNNIPLSNLSINGGPSLSNEVLLDGVPNTSPQFNQYVIIPSIDAVQEFKVQTNNMSAEFGRTNGGVVNVSMRSGTNALHGTAYEFLRNSALDANAWVNNRNGRARPPFRFHQFGVTAGGPLRRDKTFFFGGYEGLRRRTGKSFLFSVPTPDQRAGDFSTTRAQNGQMIQIFDPMTSRLVGGSYIRDAFPQNRIPASRQNAAARKMLEYWAAPNLAGHPVTGINNFISNESEAYGVNQANLRIDHSFSSKNQIFGRFSWNSSLVTPPNVFGNIANPASGPQLFTQRNFAINDTHTFSPTTFATFRIGFTRLRDNGEPLGLGFDPTQLGFPQYLRNAAQVYAFPSVNVAGYTVDRIGFGTSALGPVMSSTLNNLSNGYTAQSDVTHSRGNHVMKFGVDARLFRLHGYRPYLPSFTFGTNFTQGPVATQGSPTAGQSFATFLLGVSSSGEVRYRPTQDTQSYYFGGFFQDDYKVRPNLTVNLGLRFEAESLRTDRYNRLNWLDYDSPSALKAPGFSLRGGLQFAGVDGNPRQQADTSRLLSPRIGFAYQATGKIVVRGGYGIFVGPRTRWDFEQFGQDGFAATTQHVASIDGILPTTFINDPYPQGFLQPTGSSLGLLTQVGGPVSSVDRGHKPMYMQQWNFGLQRTMPGDHVLEVVYAGSKGTHLWQTLQFNQLPDQYLALKDRLLDRVPNPFFGLVPSTQPLGRDVTTYGQLLRPYPQFTGFTAIGSTAGSSIYHSMQFRAEKQLSHGLSYLLAYTTGKRIDDTSPVNAGWGALGSSFQNFNNLRLERSLSTRDVAQRLSLAFQYELPFGAGKALGAGLPRPVSKLVSGWQAMGITTLQSGSPLALTTSVNNTNSFGGGSRPNSTGRSAKLEGPIRERLDRFFDVSAFTLPAQFAFGNVSHTLPDVREPGLVNQDFSLVKDTKINERYSIQFRAEAFNFLNNVSFGRPGTAIGSPGAGVIATAGDARILQFALKLMY